jgi:hypothetical protein
MQVPPMTEPTTITDKAASVVVTILYAILFLAVLGLIVQYSTAPTHQPPGVRGSLLGPDWTR